MNCNTTHYRANSSSVPGDPTQLIFHPGFSTRRNVTEVSGRGVGMDVVASVLDRLRGQIEVESLPGRGTAVRLRIPLRSSIEHAMVFRIGGHMFALPMQFVRAAMPTAPEGACTTAERQLGAATVPARLPNGSPVADLPATRLRELLSLDHTPHSGEHHALIVSQGSHASSGPATPGSGSGFAEGGKGRGRIALLVDDVVGPEEVVVRPLPALFKRHRLLAGVTLSGGGEIVLLFDGRELIEKAFAHAVVNGNGQPAKHPIGEVRNVSTPLHALVVDDSVSVRRSLRQMLERRGYTVAEAADGLEALDQLRSFTFALVLTDLEMPRLGGMELLAEVRRARRTRSSAVVVVSSVDTQEMQDRARELGAQGYVPKPVTDAALAQVLASVRWDDAREELARR